MPRGFSESDKKRIRSELLSIAKEALSTVGFSKLSVSKITKKAGISKGAFYIFYDSKEQLLLELVQREEAELRENLSSLVETFNGGDGRRELFVFFEEVYRSLTENAVMLLLTNQSELEWLLSRIDPKYLQENMGDDDRYFSELFRVLREKGVLSEQYDTNLLKVIPRLLFLLKSSEDFLSAEDHDGFVKFIIGIIASQLSKD